MRLSEMVDLLGANVTVETLAPTDDLPNIGVQGKLLAADPTGVVLQTSTGVQIINISAIEDIRESEVTRKIVRRKVRHITEPQARQHLLDRHNVPWSIVRAMTPSTAFMFHAKVDHGDLGHRHKPEGEAGEE